MSGPEIKWVLSNILLIRVDTGIQIILSSSIFERTGAPANPIIIIWRVHLLRKVKLTLLLVSTPSFFNNSYDNGKSVAGIFGAVLLMFTLCFFNMRKNVLWVFKKG